MELRPETLTPEQCRAARGLLDMKQAELAASSGVGLSSIKNFEAGRTGMIANNLLAIMRALQIAGAEFLPENGSGPGVRLKKGINPRAWRDA